MEIHGCIYQWCVINQLGIFCHRNKIYFFIIIISAQLQNGKSRKITFLLNTAKPTWQ